MSIFIYINNKTIEQMKKEITKQDQQRINQLLNARRQRQVKVIKTINGVERLAQYEADNKIARNGLSYIEIDQLNNTFSNFR